MADDTFFNILKERLEKLQPPFDPASWDTLQKKLDALPLPDAAPQHPIDAAVRQHLTHLDVPYDPASWAALEQHLDALENPVHIAPVDKVVAQKLQHYEPTYSPDHWNLMKQQLQLAESRQRSLLLVKLAEAAIFLLLLWNLADFLRGDVLPTSEKNSLASTSVETTPNETASSSLAGGAAKTPDATFHIVSPPVPDQNSWIHAPVDTGSAPVPLLSYSENVAAQATQPLHPSVELPDSENQTVKKLPCLPFEELPFEQNLDMPRHNVIIFNQKVRQIYFSTYAGIGDRYTLTRDPDLTSFNHLHLSRFWATGMAVGRRGKHWGIETGIQFTSGNYQPQRKIEIVSGNPQTGYQGTYLDKVAVQTFAITTQISRKLTNLWNVEFHATAGIHPHFAIQKQAIYQNIEIPAVLGGNFPAFKVPVNTPALFEGGSLAENTWLTAQMGVRTVLPLGMRYTVFMANSVELPIVGRLQPRHAIMSSLSMSVGLMTRI